MPRNPKLFIRDHVYLIGFRAEQGLPLLCAPFMKTILLSILARANELYEVLLGDLIIMGNHIHLILRVVDPAAVDCFLRYFKTESALAINRLKGRRKGTVWEEVLLVGTARRAVRDGFATESSLKRVRRVTCMQTQPEPT